MGSGGQHNLIELKVRGLVNYVLGTQNKVSALALGLDAQISSKDPANHLCGLNGRGAYSDYQQELPHGRGTVWGRTRGSSIRSTNLLQAVRAVEDIHGPSEARGRKRDSVEAR